MPGNTEVLSGSQLEVQVDLRGEIPEKIMLFFTSSDQGRVNEPVTLRPIDDTLNRYQGIIVGVNGRGIRQELTYRIEAGDAVSEDFLVKVIQPPSATIHSVRYDYPQYMGLSPVNQPGGAIDTWEGTKVTIDATTNMPITSFEVLFSDEENSSSLLEEFKIEKTIEKNSITASWKLKLRADRSFPKYYQIKCRNEAGQTTLSPTIYPLIIRPDLPPEITLLSPKQDLKMPSNGIVPISVIAEDPDFKLRYLNLRVEKEQIRILDKTIFEGSEKSVGLTYDFALEQLRLTPGDTIYFWVEARDNKQPSGNRKNTPKIKIEILKPVSKKEAQKQLQKQKEEAAQKNQNPSPKQDMPSKKKDGNDAQSGNDGTKPNPDQTNDSKSDSGTKKGNQSESGSDQNQSDNKGNQQSDSGNPQKPDNATQDQNDAKSDKKKGLDSSGKDDQEAIKKILEQLKKEGQQPEQGSQEKQADSQNQDPQKQGTDQNKQNQKSSKSSDKPGQAPSKSSGGTPADSKNSKNTSPAPEPSSKGNQPANGASGKKQDGKIPKGKEEPASPSDDAIKRKSDGNPKGKATPNHDPDANPEKSNKDVERDPNQKPATRPGKNNAPDAKPNQNSQPDKGNSSNKSEPSTEKNPQTGMRKPENSNQNPSPSNKSKPATGDIPSTKNNQPDGSNEQPKGKNQSTEQKSKRPQDGENGNSSQNDKGQSGSKQPGKGESTGQKGNQEKGSQGKPSDSRQSMNQKQGQGKQGEKSTGNSKSESGKQNSQSKGQGKSKGGAPQGAGKSKGGEKSAPGSGKGSNPDNSEGSTATSGGGQAPSGNNQSGGDSSLPEAEDANLEYGKEAANLVLKRIKDELKRKEVDQELLNELGWTKDQMKQFSERLQKQLQKPDTNQQTLESKARQRQFEEMLKSLKPASRASQRNRSSTRKQTNDSIGPRRLPVPEEYREAYEAFTRGLAEQKSSEK